MKNRLVNTRFWDDAYCANLDPIEKLLFLYTLTNTSTNISGIYEIPLKKIAVETGIEKEMVEKILGRFERDGKVLYRNGWIALKNFLKHQNQKSKDVQLGIARELESVPIELKNFIQGGGSIDPVIPNLTKPNLTKPTEKPTASLLFLENIPSQELQQLSDKYKISQQGIKSKALDLKLYCESKGKKYKNYRSFLENALRSDKEKLQNKFPLPRGVPMQLQAADRPMTKEEKEAFVQMQKDMVGKFKLSV